MSLNPDDIRRVASILTTVAECEERAHAPILTTLHAVVEVPGLAKLNTSPAWIDYPDRLIGAVMSAGSAHGLEFASLLNTPVGWQIVWRSKGSDLALASSPQERPEIVLRAELARLTDLNTKTI